MRQYLIALTLITTLLNTTCPPRPDEARLNIQLLEKSCHYLWNQQSADGGWHSSTHGILRGGESLTPFILHTLLQVPSEVYQASESQINRGLDFIRMHIDEDGIIGKSDPDILDYPNYSTAHALMVLDQVQAKEDVVLIEKMASYLLSQQFVETRGFQNTNAPYGGWGFGETHLSKGKTGHVDLSHTRRILQALNGHNGFKEAQKKALYYFRLTQKNPNEARLHPTKVSHKKIPYDGGFFASPVTLSTNKGGIAAEDSLEANYFRSYATATCDGILGLLAAGHSVNEESIQMALKWLDKNPKWDYPQGIPLDDPDQWHEVMFYYHLSVRAQVYAIVQHPSKWRQKIIDLLNTRQQEEGYFYNPMGGPNKEDDPLLATAFAVIALTCVGE